MNILVCVKRVPAAGGRMTLTPDQQDIDTRFLGFTVSPHEECAVEEAVRLIELHGGESTALTLGAEVAIDQLRDALALGVDRAILLETDGREWDPGATAAAIVEAVNGEWAQGREYDLLLFGNEAADTGDYQVGVRVAYGLDLPCVTGVKQLEIRDGSILARREADDGWEVFQVPLPAVVAVKEGINLPRYPSVPGRLRARRKDVQRIAPSESGAGLRKVRLVLQKEPESAVEILGSGAGAAPRIVKVLQGLGLV